jgi:hypothetical protein
MLVSRMVAQKKIFRVNIQENILSNLFEQFFPSLVSSLEVTPGMYAHNNGMASFRQQDRA